MKVDVDKGTLGPLYGMFSGTLGELTTTATETGTQAGTQAGKAFASSFSAVGPAVAVGAISTIAAVAVELTGIAAAASGALGLIPGVALGARAAIGTLTLATTTNNLRKEDTSPSQITVDRQMGPFRVSYRAGFDGWFTSELYTRNRYRQRAA